MKATAINTAIEKIEKNNFGTTLSTVAHYVSAKGRIGTTEGTVNLLQELGIWHEGGLHFYAIVSALGYMIDNFWQEMADNEYTMEQQAEEYCKDLLEMLKDEGTAIFMAMDNYDYDEWAPVWRRYQAKQQIKTVAC